jgi:hypothetical protein
MEPNLTVIIANSDAVNCYLEALARDDRDLGSGPLPYSKKHHGVPVKNAKRPAMTKR